MEVKNLSWKTAVVRHNHPLLPKSIRGLIIGKSGCGKTTLLMNLLLNPGWLDYDRLFVFGKSLFQTEYIILKKAMEEKLSKENITSIFEHSEMIRDSGIPISRLIEEISKTKNNKTDIECYFYDQAEDVPDPRDLDSNDKNLMIFDDLLLEKQNMCENYYTRGRHSNIDCFYLAQNYFKLPRQTIRENANFMCIFPQDRKNISHMYSDHVANDMSLEEFRDLCKKAWGKQHGFLVIDLSSKLENGKYRSGFNDFYIKKINV